jgi:hypothetical protein
MGKPKAMSDTMLMGIRELVIVCKNTLDGEDYISRWERYSEEDFVKLLHAEYLLEDGVLDMARVHADWVNEQLADGWFLGDTFDDKLKTDPSLVEYEKLSKTALDLDKAFSGMVSDYLTMKGIERREENGAFNKGSCKQ